MKTIDKIKQHLEETDLNWIIKFLHDNKIIFNFWFCSDWKRKDKVIIYANCNSEVYLLDFYNHINIQEQSERQQKKILYFLESLNHMKWINEI